MSRRETYHLDPVKHNAPIPMGAKVGNVVFSSAIGGANPATGVVPEGIDEQCENAFQNLRNFLAKAGATTDDVVRISVFMKSEANRQKINKPWLEMFPDEQDRPARHQLVVENMPLPYDVQIEAIAVLPTA
ncbi:MAG: RidA family protein [Dehalococcoidia bacterium]|nr:RidA family protein [Dehalococcoidia bacterium]